VLLHVTVESKGRVPDNDDSDPSRFITENFWSTCLFTSL
jgi:hypothetical protein